MSTITLSSGSHKHILKDLDYPIYSRNISAMSLKDFISIQNTGKWDNATNVNLFNELKNTFKREFAVSPKVNVLSSFRGTLPKDIKATVKVSNVLSPTKNSTVTNTVNIFNQKSFVVPKTISLTVSVVTVKNYTSSISTALQVLINKLNNAGQVIADIRFYSSMLDSTSYDRVITPYGYSRWKQMITGDYIYKDALCKFVLKASLNSARPNARVYTHKVDVPDIIVRDTISLTVAQQQAGAVKVKFKDANVISGVVDKTRIFHIVPEVSTAVKSYSGTATYPVIIIKNITEEDFEVEMKVDTQYVAGTFTYAARGY